MTKQIMYYVKNIGLKGIVPILIIVIAVFGARLLISTKPVATKKPPVVSAPLVNVMVVKAKDYNIWTPVMGTVQAACKISLEPQVAGKVISVSDKFIPGGYFEKGQEILRIDPLDYELEVKQQEASVVDADYNLKVEQGHQKVAGREWKLLKKSSGGTAQEATLALRKPHLEKAEADYSSAKAKLQQARVNLSRTIVRAPFSAMIESKVADLGANLGEQEEIATLVGTEEFWVMVSVPVDRLDRLVFPNAANGFKGSVARVISGSGESSFEREGHLLRLLPSLESQGRMARVIVTVEDPLNLKGKEGVQPLLLGSYINVSIDSGHLNNVFAIPRTAYRDDNTLWIMSSSGTLEIRKVDAVWRDKNFIYLGAGLTDGEKLVTTDISTPLKGMNLRENVSVKGKE
ncbi:efflux RND transporter periplasmic adaptor subunit [Desulfovibrio gilichinskyi]|uniref:RND family efflux transporter, MFP subunit n=1 Tax=Desulfovibrio gilichinskyi TaxID=1519643 RepID=A0A1X7DN22_9BACT|nr:efflux RND transporter periplasmic adaptor subunit [Desulfovibrio gilichinskyi]SMF18483.1 RND family efflux transporter, MFP subunit [Desulfovibrio gilichinskyi]